ncbi:Crp/Fnr family transcriptional regulator [Roseicella aerolata]|uniref:Crp/Fnr family transcriptional regulator n=1 Tax=Roseicella aerolata TaxID=2883479 RepID=A0A9X1L7F4_9PROT|nr:Crp/Fnr family transcriptional regulator [Roseicella aerolata]MCB4821906.1 Crp/Fnr family transcriptional regulator [Roseicella aerolata]
MAPSDSRSVPRNGLLAALPPEDLARFRRRLELVDLPLRHVLHAPDAPIGAVHFPETSWISLLAMLEGGDAAGVGMIGREGMVGLPLLYGTDQSPFEAMAQMGGNALRLDAAAFRDALEHSPALRALLLRYARAFSTQVSWTAACNGRHLLEQRLTRWMLIAHDRAGGDDFPMTHEFLAMMLGVRRAGVTVAAGALQRAGLIRYDRGRITVSDRRGLEAAACECYGMVRREFRRLLGPEAEG